MRVRRVVSKNRFWEVQILSAISVFLVLYVVFASKLFLNDLVRLLFGPECIRVFGHPLVTESVFIGIGKYGRDFVLGYALFIAVAYWLREEKSGLEIAAVIAAGAEIVIELFRMTAVLSSVGFIWNLAACLLGTALALLVVLIHEGKLI